VVATTEVKALAAHQAGDDGLVEHLVRLVNRAYAIGEAGLWIDGTARTAPDEIAAAIRSAELLAATTDGRLVGCARVRPLDADTADLALVSAVPEQWGGGVGRALVRSAEVFAHARGSTTMQLELLVPKHSTHPAKQRLRAWYSRLGYRVVRTAPFEELAAHLAPRLATPCEFLIFRKRLTAAP
jgi:GNAT superfamily N-acetyltransferase